MPKIRAPLPSRRRRVLRRRRARATALLFARGPSRARARRAGTPQREASKGDRAESWSDDSASEDDQTYDAVQFFVFGTPAAEGPDASANIGDRRAAG